MPQNKNVFSSAVSRAAVWRRRAATRLVHRVWRSVQEAGSVTAERPGRLRFGRFGWGTRLAFPLGTVFGERWIHLGACCIIGEQVTLTVGLAPSDLDFGHDPVISIGDGVVLGRGSHVVAMAPITLGEKVYCGPNVYITSTNHSYRDTATAIGEQWPQSAPVEIGPGSWLGVNSVVLPGARLGRNVVVAAGSVVRGEVPDYAVVAGAPARIVRRWTPEAGWQPPLRPPAGRRAEAGPAGPGTAPAAVPVERRLDVDGCEEPAGA